MVASSTAASTGPTGSRWSRAAVVACLASFPGLLGCESSDPPPQQPLQAPARNYDEAAKHTQSAEAEANSRSGRILAEISQLQGHPWAGKYYFGDGLGVNSHLTIAPKSGFVFEWHGCLGCYDRNWGEVQERDGALHLDFHFPNGQADYSGCAPVLVPLDQDEKRYLVEPSQLDEVRDCGDTSRVFKLWK